MKFITISLLLFSGLSFASQSEINHSPKKKMGCVYGDRAETIFNDLDVESRSKESDRGTIEVKRSGPLVCANLSNDEADRYRCCFKKRRPGKGKIEK